MTQPQDRLNLAASAYLDAAREFLRSNYGNEWEHFPEDAVQAAVIAAAVQTLLLPSVQPGLDGGLAFANVGVALGVHTASLPDETFTALMGMLAEGAGQGRAHRVAQIINWPTVGGMQ